MSSKPKIADLVAKARELGITDEADAKKLIKEKAVKSYKKLMDAIEASKKPTSPKIPKVRKTGVIHEKGVRGWKYGPVWMQSIKDGKNVALKPSNLPKLKDMAQNYGIEVTDEMTQLEIAAKIALAI